MTGVAGPRVDRPRCTLYGQPLTEREMQVLSRISLGLTNGEIGRDLYLSEDTVKTYVRTLLRKLGARDRAHAVRRGYETGRLPLVTAAGTAVVAS